VSDETREHLIREIEGDEFHLSPLPDRIILNDAEAIIDKNKGKGLKAIEEEIINSNRLIPVATIHEMFTDISDFLYTDPKLPDSNKNYLSYNVPDISVNDKRESIIGKIIENARDSEFSQLTMYTYRMMDKIDWLPFIKAAVERNPVCFQDLKGKNIQEVHDIIIAMPDESIYDGQRLAQPDEVWNFRRGDGIEKALLLADYIIQKNEKAEISIVIQKHKVRLQCSGNDYHFKSDKSFDKVIEIKGNGSNSPVSLTVR
jgi:hypothetical protein